VATGSDFAGNDPRYLRTVQYADSTKLSARARLHARHATASVPWFPWLVGRIEWPSRARVLDVGCGPGWLWERAASDLPDDATVALADQSPGMAHEATRRACASGFAASAVVADVQALPWPSGRFDVVVAAHMLYHAPDPDRAVTELARVLRAGGTALVTTNGEAHLAELDEIRTKVLGGSTLRDTIAAFGAARARQVLPASFGSVTWQRYRNDLRCTDPDDVVAFITSAPPGEDADASQLARLREAVAARFDSGDGVMHITTDTGVFVCRQPRC
jgi:2-polyprenyl-3-methyl-5-hydroxy-6-metoxy-1,4-benzoquinol methylase